MSKKKSSAKPAKKQAPSKIAVEDALEETRAVLEYAEAINTLIENVVTDKYDCPEATEEQRKQVEVLAASQRETLDHLDAVSKKALDAVQASAAPAAAGGQR